VRWQLVIEALAAALTVSGILYPAHGAESEPNNTRAQANPLTLNLNGQATNIGRINPLSDLDFFSITTPTFSGFGTLVLTMTPTSSDGGLDARIQLQDNGGALLADRDVGFDDAPETLTFSQATGGTTYYIVCRSADIIDAGSGDYRIQVSLATDDPDDQISGAAALGAINQTVARSGAIDAATDVDIFSFSVTPGQRISFDIDQTAALDSHLRLFNGNGLELFANNNAPGPGEVSGGNSYLEYTFTNSGTFYLGISGSGNTGYDAVTGTGDASASAGGYTLVVSPGLAGTIRRPGDTTDYLVDLRRFGINPISIDSNQRTWIVVHGWNSSRSNENIFAVAESLFQTRPGDQVLTLDWSAAADTLSPFLAEDSIVPVAQWAAAALDGYGFAGTNLNLVGHSFGSYVADEIAQRVPGGVNTIVTLDPAVDVFGGYDPDANDEVNFARDSLFSWSFHSSSLGNAYTPTTADEAFLVDSSADAITAHGNVVFLFAYMLLHPEDIVSQYFLMTLLLNGTEGPWLPDQYEASFPGDAPIKGYEAVIGTADNGLRPSGLTYIPLPLLSIAKSGNNVSISWRSSYTNFFLQSSPFEGNSLSWTNVSASPLLVGQSNVVTISAAGQRMIFRLKRL
jgi:pimeloyl-ACP methyl ester carboxylesterase